MVACGSAIPCSDVSHGDIYQSLHHVTYTWGIVPCSSSCSTMAMAPTSGSEKRPSFKQRVLMITPGGELSTAIMHEVVQISSTASATIFSPTPLHVHAPFEADALDINGSPFIVDVPSSGGSNSSDGLHEQSDTQLLPTSHEPSTKK